MSKRASVITLDDQKVENNCKKLQVIKKGSILERYIRDINGQNYADQKQLPNPTIVQKGDKYLVVFTAYLLEGRTTTEIAIDQARRLKKAAQEKLIARKSKNLVSNAGSQKGSQHGEKEDEEDDPIPENDDPGEVIDNSDGYPSIYFYNIEA